MSAFQHPAFTLQFPQKLPSLVVRIILKAKTIKKLLYSGFSNVRIRCFSLFYMYVGFGMIKYVAAVAIVFCSHRLQCTLRKLSNECLKMHIYGSTCSRSYLKFQTTVNHLAPNISIFQLSNCPFFFSSFRHSSWIHCRKNKAQCQPVSVF